MLLALVLAVQATTAAAAATPNPCADQMSELCKISPLFCPGAYPSDLTPGNGRVPCWPEAPVRDTRVVSRPPASTERPTRAMTSQSSAPSQDSTPKGDERSRVSRFFARLLESR